MLKECHLVWTGNETEADKRALKGLQTQNICQLSSAYASSSPGTKWVAVLPELNSEYLSPDLGF